MSESVHKVVHQQSPKTGFINHSSEKWEAIEATYNSPKQNSEIGISTTKQNGQVTQHKYALNFENVL